MTTNPTIERLANHPVLPTKRTLALIECAKHGDRAAEEKIIRHSTRLLKDVLRSLSYPPHLLDDLFVSGQMGIRRAIRRYRPGFAATWATYAYNAAYYQMATLLTEYRRSTDDSPRARQGLLYLTPDADDSPDGELLKACDRLRLRAHLRVLDDREHYIICSHYGIDQSPRQLTEIGESIGISRQRAGQIRKRALSKLHASMSSTMNSPKAS